MTSSSDAEFLAAFGGGSPAPAKKPKADNSKEGLAGKIGRNIFGVIPKPIRKAGLKIAAPIGIAADLAGRPIKAGINTAANTVGNSGFYKSFQDVNAIGNSKVKGGLHLGPVTLGGHYDEAYTKKKAFVSNNKSFGDVMKHGIGMAEINRQVPSWKAAENSKSAYIRTAVYAGNALGEIKADPMTSNSLGIGEDAAAVSARKAAAKLAEREAKATFKSSIAKEAELGLEGGATRAAAKDAWKSAKKVTDIAGKPIHGIGRKAVASKLADAGFEESANRVLKKGWQAAPEAHLAEVGLKSGLNVGGVGVVGGELGSKVARGARAISPARLVNAVGDASKATSGGEALAKKFEKTAGGVELGKKSPMDRLRLEQATELGGKSGEASKGRWTTGANEAMKPFAKALKKVDGSTFFKAVEGDAASAARIEAEHPGMLGAWKQHITQSSHDALNGHLGGDLPNVPNYIRRTNTKEYDKYLKDSPQLAERLKANPMEAEAKKLSAAERRLKPGDVFDPLDDGRGVELQTASTDEINAIARQKLGFDIYETDVRRSLKSTADQIGQAASTARRNEHLIKTGRGAQDVLTDIPGAAAEKVGLANEMGATRDATQQALDAKLQNQGAVAGSKALQGDLTAQAREGYRNAARANTAADAVPAPSIADAAANADAAWHSIGDPAAEHQAAVAAAQGKTAATRGEYNATMRDARLDPSADVNAARRDFNGAQRAQVQVEADQAHVARTEILKQKALEAGIELERVRGVAKQGVAQRAAHWADAERFATEADALMTAGDRVGGDVKSLLSQSAELKATLKENLSASQSAKRAYKDLKTEDMLSAVEDGWRKHGYYKGGDMLVKDDIKQALSKMESLKVTRPGALLEGFDRIMGIWKAQQLMTPGFHVRNYMGGLFNNWLAGASNESYALFEKNWKRYKDGGLEAIPNVQVRGAFENMIKDGSIGGKAQGVEMGAAARGLGHEGSALNPLRSNFVGYKVNEAVGDGVENRLRGTLYLDSMMKGMSQEEAFFRTIRFHYNGQFRSQVEDKWLGRMFPFFTYTRNNMPLQWEMMLTQPGKYTAFRHVQDAMSANPDPREAPDNLGDFSLRTPFDVNGSAAYTKFDLQYRDIDSPLREGTRYFTKQFTPGAQELIERNTGTKLSNGESYKSQPWLNQNFETAKRFIPALKYVPMIGDENKVGNALFGEPKKYKPRSAEAVNRRRNEKRASIIGGVGLTINDAEVEGATNRRNAKKGIVPKSKPSTTKSGSDAEFLAAFGG